MRRICVLLLCLLIAPPLAFGQQTVKIKDYVSNRVGERWQYKNFAPDEFSPVTVIVSTTTRRAKNNPIKQRANNRLTENALKIYRLYLTGDRVIEYEQPLLPLPDEMQIGQMHRAEIAYQPFAAAEAENLIYETTPEKIETVETRAGEHKNCLLIRIVALHTDKSGAQKGYDLREWHSPDKTPVKITGEFFQKNAAGQTTNNLKINAEIETTKQFDIGKPFTKTKRNFFERICTVFVNIFR